MPATTAWKWSPPLENEPGTNVFNCRCFIAKLAPGEKIAPKQDFESPFESDDQEQLFRTFVKLRPFVVQYQYNSNLFWRTKRRTQEHNKALPMTWALFEKVVQGSREDRVANGGRWQPLPPRLSEQEDPYFMHTRRCWFIGTQGYPPRPKTWPILAQSAFWSLFAMGVLWGCVWFGEWLRRVT